MVPKGIDDPARPSGGNRYDRRVMDGLRERGWTVASSANRHEWPAETTGMAGVLVVDALLGIEEPDRYPGAVVLLHMPFAEAHPELRSAERVLLKGATAVVATSRWSRDWVVTHHDLDPARVVVVEPGVDPAALVPPSPEGTRLVCVGPITRPKGHDILLAALADVADLDWTCTLVGALDLEPDLVETIRGSVVAPRIRLTGPLPAPPYDEADLLVSASRHESYGMAVTEALGHGIPVLVTDVGGHREAAGDDQALVPAGDPAALAAALRQWLTDPAERARLRDAAAHRRRTLPPWSATVDSVEAVLNRLVT